MAENRAGTFTPDKVEEALRRLKPENRIGLPSAQEIVMKKLPVFFQPGCTVGDYISAATHAVDRTSRTIREKGGFELVFVGPSDSQGKTMSAREVRWLPHPITYYQDVSPSWTLQYSDFQDLYSLNCANQDIHCAWDGFMDKEQTQFSPSDTVNVGGLYWAYMAVDEKGLVSANVHDRYAKLPYGAIQEIYRSGNLRYFVKRKGETGNSRVSDEKVDGVIDGVLYDSQNQRITLPVVEGNIMTTSIITPEETYPLTLPIAVLPQPDQLTT